MWLIEFWCGFGVVTELAVECGIVKDFAMHVVMCDIDSGQELRVYSP